MSTYAPSTNFATKDALPSGDPLKIVKGTEINTEFVNIALAINSNTSSDQVTYTPAGTGAVATTVQTKLRESVSVKDFGAVGDGVADDTAAIQAAVDAVFNAGGGTVYIPTGTYLVSSIVKNWIGAVTVNIRGAGKRATKLKKKTGTLTPVLDFSSDVSILDVYCEFSDFWIQGDSKNNNGIRATRLARWSLRNILIESCDVGIDNFGSLVFSVYDCTIQSNSYGYRCAKSGAIRANLVQFFGGQIGANTIFGMDVGDAAGVHLYGTDLSANGTAGNTATGAIMLRATMDDETGYSSFTLNNVWFEANYGRTLQTEAVTGLMLTLKDVFISSPESGRAATIGAIFSSEISNTTAGGTGDTITIAAARSVVTGGIIHTLTDTSARYRHINVGTSAANVDDTFKGNVKRHKLGTVDYLFGQASQITGGSADDVEYYLYGSGEQKFSVGGTYPIRIGGGTLGFHNATPVIKQTVTGAKGGNVALANLLTTLSNIGLITDSST